MKNLVDLEGFVDPAIELVFKYLDDRIGSKKESDVCMNELLTFFAADAVGELAVSIRFLLSHSLSSLLS